MMKKAACWWLPFLLNRIEKGNILLFVYIALFQIVQEKTEKNSWIWKLRRKVSAIMAVVMDFGQNASAMCLKIMPSGQVAVVTCPEFFPAGQVATATCLKFFYSGQVAVVMCLKFFCVGQVAVVSSPFWIPNFFTTDVTCFYFLTGYLYWRR